MQAKTKMKKTELEQIRKANKEIPRVRKLRMLIKIRKAKDVLTVVMMINLKK